MRVYVESFGCAQNQGEGRAIARDLAAHGHTVLPRSDGADVGVLVTCAVIGPTESHMVRRWRELSRQLPRVIVTGCLVPLRTELLTGPGRDRTTLVPIREQGAIPNLLGPEPRESHAPRNAAPAAGGPTPRISSEEVVIAQGCTSGCSYCFSRLARGRLASVSSLEVARQVAAAHRRGSSEVRLASLDTAAWGADLPTGERLPELIDAVEGVAGDFQVRVGMMSPQSLEPIRDRYFDSLARSRAFRFLHLPVQSGSDTVLGRMRRGYTADQFRDQVRSARARFPELHVSTDVLVGFPGETEDDHRATELVLEQTLPETVNVTRFSPRPGTPAAKLTPVPGRVAKERSRRITALRQRLQRERLERWIGWEGEARVSEYGPDGSSVGRLPNYLPVVLLERPPLGRRVSVRVVGARTTYLLGRSLGAAL